MDVLLIIPPFNLLEQGYGSKSKIKRGNLPPLGLCYVAACLERAGHVVRILDCEAKGLTKEEVLKFVENFKPGLICMSCTLAHYPSCKELVESLKAKYKIPILLGGPQPTSFPEKIMHDLKDLDFLVVGEGEKAIVEITSKLEKKENIFDIKGLVYKTSKGDIKINGKGDPYIKLDDIPSPSWHLLDMKVYSPLPDQYKKQPATSYLTSRGCSWAKCTFCYQSGDGKPVYRRHSPERVVKDLKHLQDIYGIQEILFLDDLFFCNEDWIEKFCKLLSQENLKLSWSAYGKVGLLTQKMVKLCRQVGCWSIFFGIESGNQDILDTINKGCTLDDFRDVSRWCHEEGMEIRGSFIIGLPGETSEKALNTINFAIELDVTTAAFHPFFPERGTELYRRALSEGKVVEDWNGRATAAYVPEGYKNAEELEKMVRTAFMKFYFRPKYIYKRVKSINSVSELKRNIEGFSFLVGLVRNI